MQSKYANEKIIIIVVEHWALSIVRYALGS